jgi:AraC-like DNA-binding protein
MIVERKRYELFGKKIFEKLLIQSPFKIPNPMPDEACFLYILQGQINYSTPNQNVIIPQNDAVLLKCGAYFSQIKSTIKAQKHEIVVIHFHPEILKKIYETDLPKVFQHPSILDTNIDLSTINNDYLIEKYIESLLFYFDNPSLINEDLLIIKLKEIILLLCQTKNAPLIQQILSQLFSPSSYSFKQIIESNLYYHFTTEELAEMTHFSLSSFKREFKKNYNATPASYIRNKRLEKAAELLLISEERITDIAFDCGFNDLANFSKLFHEKFNNSPSNYRLDQKSK